MCLRNSFTHIRLEIYVSCDGSKLKIAWEKMKRQKISETLSSSSNCSQYFTPSSPSYLNHRTHTSPENHMFGLSAKGRKVIFSVFRDFDCFSQFLNRWKTRTASELTVNTCLSSRFLSTEFAWESNPVEDAFYECCSPAETMSNVSAELIMLYFK